MRDMKNLFFILSFMSSVTCFAKPGDMLFNEKSAGSFNHQDRLKQVKYDSGSNTCWLESLNCDPKEFRGCVPDESSAKKEKIALSRCSAMIVQDQIKKSFETQCAKANGGIAINCDEVNLDKKSCEDGRWNNIQAYNKYCKITVPMYEIFQNQSVNQTSYEKSWEDCRGNHKYENINSSHYAGMNCETSLDDYSEMEQQQILSIENKVLSSF
jgi:hypothetical protein